MSSFRYSKHVCAHANGVVLVCVAMQLQRLSYTYTHLPLAFPGVLDFLLLLKRSQHSMANFLLLVQLNASAPKFNNVCSGFELNIAAGYHAGNLNQAHTPAPQVLYSLHLLPRQQKAGNGISRQRRSSFNYCWWSELCESHHNPC